MPEQDYQTIEIPGQGQFKFPKEMRDDRIKAILTQKGIIQQPKPASALDTALDTALDVGKGIVKGAGRSIEDMNPFKGTIPQAMQNQPGITQRVQKAEQSVEPTNTAQKVGGYIEGGAELAYGGTELAKGIRAILGSEVLSKSATEIKSAINKLPKDKLSKLWDLAKVSPVVGAPVREADAWLTLGKRVFGAVEDKLGPQIKRAEGMIRRSGLEASEVIGNGEKLHEVPLQELRDRITYAKDLKAKGVFKGKVNTPAPGGKIEISEPIEKPVEKVKASKTPQPTPLPQGTIATNQQVPQQPLPKVEGKVPSGTIQGEIVQPQPQAQAQAPSAAVADKSTIPSPASALGPKRDAAIMESKDSFKSSLIKWAERQKSIPTQERLEKTVWVREGKLNIKEALDTVAKRFTIP